jgi:hypothetical protein
MEENVLQNVQSGISDTFKGYPLKKRVVSALVTLGILLIVGLNWRFEPAKIIALAAFTVARLFDLRGRWSIFFHGIGVGDLLLYAASAGLAIHY